MAKGPICYTIGYGDRTLEDFISLLQNNKISHLVDIRRYPHSWMEHFDKESLQAILPKNGIAYVHCTGVGGMRESSYNEYMGPEEFNNSFSRLVDFIMEVNDIDEEIQRIVEKVNYKLPAYKRIKKIEIVEEFEKTPLNKIKRYKYQK